MRDPRTNPQKGDVLRLQGKRYDVESVLNDQVNLVITFVGGRMKSWCDLGSWRKWARDAEVVTGEG